MAGGVKVPEIQDRDPRRFVRPFRIKYRRLFAGHEEGAVEHGRGAGQFKLLLLFRIQMDRDHAVPGGVNRVRMCGVEQPTRHFRGLAQSLGMWYVPASSPLPNEKVSLSSQSRGDACSTTIFSSPVARSFSQMSEWGVPS